MSSRYTTGAIVLHWAIALLIIANILIAELTEDFSDAERAQYMGVHMAFGFTVLILSFIRYYWRMKYPRPAYPEGMKGWEIALGRAVHGIFYFLILALPISGWLMVSPYGGFDYFGLFQVPGLTDDKGVAEFGHETHEIMGTAMLYLAILHTLAALKHQFVDRVPFLARMGIGRTD